jgi:hypothetical protein
MRFPTLLTIAAVLGVIFGLGFLFVPASTLHPYGVNTDPSGLIMSQFFGAALIQLALVFFALRKLPATNIPGVALGACLGELAGLWVAIRIQLGGHVNALGWSTVAIYAVLAICFGMFAFGIGRWVRP